MVHHSPKNLIPGSARLKAWTKLRRPVGTEAGGETDVFDGHLAYLGISWHGNG